MTNDAHSIMTEFSKLTEMERHIIARFIRRERVAKRPHQGGETLGERIADRVASFGGSWTFIFIAVSAIILWMVYNAVTQPFDPYPFILLNLVLSCTAALQAPIIMMSQNRQSARDRIDAQHDYEINTKAELEIVGLHAKIDEVREQKWIELLALQERQLELLSQLTNRLSTGA